jgi:hypothetical protein
MLAISNIMYAACLLLEHTNHRSAEPRYNGSYFCARRRKLRLETTVGTLLSRANIYFLSERAGRLHLASSSSLIATRRETPCSTRLWSSPPAAPFAALRQSLVKAGCRLDDSRVAGRPCESNHWMLEKDGCRRQGGALRIQLARFARQSSPCLDLVTNRNRLASQLLVPSLTKADNGTLANDRFAPQASSVRRRAIWHHNGRPALFAFLRLALSAE